MTEGLDDLTDLEQLLVAAAHDGRTLAPPRSADGQRPPIRGSVIRHLMLGDHSTDGRKLDPRGVQLAGCEVSGHLDLAYLTCPVRLELTDCTLSQTIQLRNARLPELVLERCQLTTTTGPALHGDRLTVDGGMFLGDGFTASSPSPDGTVRLVGARIGGPFDCTGGQLTNTGTGPALHGDQLTADGEMFLGDGFTASSPSPKGTVRLLGARIGGPFDCTNGQLTNTGTGPALHGDQLTIDGDMFLRGGFTASSPSPKGTLRLLGAHIGSQLSCTGGQLTNTGTGPALAGDGLTVDGDMFLRGGFSASSPSSEGTLRLLGAHIGGQLDCTGGQLTNTGTGPALQGHGLKVADDMHLLANWDMPVHPEAVLIDLRSASARQLFLDPAGFGVPVSLPVEGQGIRLIRLTGLTYQLRPRGDLGDWVRLLRYGTKGYAAQPYQQYAAACLAEGHLGDYRTVLVTQQDDRRERILAKEYKATTNRRRRLSLAARRAGLRASRAVVGYGYRPWKAAWWLLAILLAAIALSVTAGHVKASNTTGQVAYRPATAQLGSIPHDCSVIEQIGLGLRLATPIISATVQGNCQLSTSHQPGWIFVTAATILQALSWATATLIITGYTSIIRRT